jgi:D-alanyl-D-alanine carboxypeptidase
VASDLWISRLFGYGLLLPCLIAVECMSAGAATPPTPDDRILVPSRSTAFSAAVDEIVNTQILSLNIPSVTVAVMKDGVIVHQGAYGLERVAPDAVTTVSTPYLLDSLTKQFTAAAIMILVQQGKLKLDQPIKTYVPYAPKSWDKVTLRHLLTHTSGLPHDPKWGYPSIQKQASNPDDVLKHHVFNQPLKSDPGDKYAYSNTGYAALGAIVEKVSGQTYPMFLENNIFKPLGMKSTVIHWESGSLRKAARGYLYDSGKKQWSPDYEEDQPLTAGGLQSTVLDLAKWDAALRTDKVLTAASKKEMWTSFVLNDKDPSGYGFGWAVGKLSNKQKVIWHSGGGWGFDTAFFRFLDAGVTVVVLTNLQFETDGPDHAVQLAQSIATAYDPALNMDSGGAAGSTMQSEKSGNTTSLKPSENKASVAAIFENLDKKQNTPPPQTAAAN